MGNGFEFVIHVYSSRYKRYTIYPSLGNEGQQEKSMNRSG